MKFLSVLCWCFLIGGCATRPPAPPKSAPSDDLSDYPKFLLEWGPTNEVQLPLALIRNQEGLTTPVLSIEIDGVVERFLIDTGAQSCLVRKEFLARHKFTETRFQAEIESFRHSHVIDIVALKNLALGFATLQEMPAHVTSEAELGSINSELREAGHAELNGIIGMDFLTSLGASIDLRRSTITLKRPAPPATTTEPRPSAIH